MPVLLVKNARQLKRYQLRRRARREPIQRMTRKKKKAIKQQISIYELHSEILPQID